MRHYRAWPATALSAVALTLLARGASAQRTDSRSTLAVMYFANGTIGAAQVDFQPLGVGIAGLLLVELSNNPNVRVIDREDLPRALASQGLGAGGRVNRETAVRVGNILGVQHVIFGGFVTDGRGTLRLDARLVNVDTGEIESVEAVQGRQNNIMMLVVDLAGRFNRGLRLPEIPRGVRESSVERARKVSFEAVMLYSRALAAKDNGRADEAARLLGQALASAPEFEAAWRELGRVRVSREASWERWSVE